jgi:hypothetical protein
MFVDNMSAVAIVRSFGQLMCIKLELDAYSVHSFPVFAYMAVA